MLSMIQLFVFCSALLCVYTPVERSSFFLNSVLSALTQVAGFTSFRQFVNTITPLHSVNGILPFQFNLIDMLFRVIFGRPRPLLPATSKSNTLLKTTPLSFLKTCPYHRTPLALGNPSKVSLKPSKQVLDSFLSQ